ncbi:MAG TPA: EAL domain-containing protein, partial [Rhodocyclaceae bacterium]|nr:EAL domain-containing protein [Rhodocyclaceae bacterium]
FGQLKNFPVAMLKIDGQFVRGMGADPLDLAIVHSTCEVARALNLLTVAEFVEDEATLNKLKDMGVNYAQGYAIHKPSLAAAEV